MKAGEKEHGLFPYLAGTEDVTAEVRDLKVVVEEYSPKKDAAGGALVCRAEKSIISGVSVTLNKYAAPVGGDSAGGSGLAGTVVADALIENCNVKAAAGDYRTFGGIAYENKGSIKNCEFQLLNGTSTLGAYGGIAYLNYGTVADSRASLPNATISAAGDNIGGLVGGFFTGEITGCTSVFQLPGEPVAQAVRVGGVCGFAEGGIIENCSVSGGTVLAYNSIGGITGAGGAKTPLTIKDCVSNIESIGLPGYRVNVYAGGLVGSAELKANLTIQNCTASTDIYGRGYVGGLIGFYRYRNLGTVKPEGLSFRMTDCVSHAGKVDAVNGVVGGAIGFCGHLMGANDAFTDDIVTQSVIQNCTVYADVVSGAANTGGFVGIFECAEPGGNTFLNCRAGGNVVGTLYSVGGFVGYLHPDSKNAVFRNCAAEGNVSVSDANGATGAGGFMGNNVGTAHKFYASTARGNVSGGAAVGGFAGNERGSGTVYGAGGSEGCYAYGAVSAFGLYSGGFIGYQRNEAGAVLVTNCHAVGDVTVAVTGDIMSAGGFIGEQNGSEIKDCSSSGNVTATQVNGQMSATCGGFVGNTANANFTNIISNCKAFGDVNGGTYGKSVGGFIGEFGDNSGKSSVSNCESYGKVAGNSAVGGFAGMLTLASAILNNVSYCPEVSATTDKGDFVGYIWDIATQNFSNNKYAKVAGCTVNGGNMDLPLSAAAPIPVEEVKESPKNVLMVTLTASGSATKVAFAFTNAAGYSLISFEISTDASKTYTALVWDKVALVDLAPGALTCTNFSYTYAAPCTANTKVRVKLTNGVDTVTTEFTYK